MNITLIYLDFPFWRAEVSRIALFMGGVDFNDRRIGSEEFQRVKANGYLDDGTLMPFRPVSYTHLRAHETKANRGWPGGGG